MDEFNLAGHFAHTAQPVTCERALCADFRNDRESQNVGLRTSDDRLTPVNLDNTPAEPRQH